MRTERVYHVLFDEWPQGISVPAVNLVEIPAEAVAENDDEDDES